RLDSASHSGIRPVPFSVLIGAGLYCRHGRPLAALPLTLHAVKRNAIKKFEIPAYYRSPVSGRVKEVRRSQDIRKKDFTPTLLDFGPVRFYIARHFGFCYGVENAIYISY